VECAQGVEKYLEDIPFVFSVQVAEAGLGEGVLRFLADIAAVWRARSVVSKSCAVCAIGPVAIVGLCAGLVAHSRVFVTVSQIFLTNILKSVIRRKEQGRRDGTRCRSSGNWC